MNVLSLFDGIGTGRLVLHNLGVQVDHYYASEIEPNAIAIAKKNFPDIEEIGDVCNVKASDFTHIDLLIGGSPCQSLSQTTGKNRTGLDGKSKLFYEYLRLKNEINPKWFLLENVASMSDEDKNTISRLMGCEPIRINSNRFSAQDRDRLYWTNIPVQLNSLPNCGLTLKDILEKDVPEKYYYNCAYDFYGEESKVCATLHINGHDILKRVNSKYFKSPTLTCVSGGNQQKKVYDEGRCRKLTPVEYERLQTLPDDYTAGFSDGVRYTAVGNGWTHDVILWLLRGLLLPN